jgi:3-oxoacyl-[acyl-carrier protein] reductase
MGPPTILFNNAGLTLKSGVKSLDEISIDDFEYTWRANCGSAYLLTQLCLPAMVSAGFGRVVFCSSVAGFIGGVVGPHYASSKSALHGLVHWLAGHYAKTGVTVNAVAPALIEETKMLPGGGDRGTLEASEYMSFPRWVFRRLSLESCDEKMCEADDNTEIPIGRLGKPEEVAETVVWMIKTGYVNNKVRRTRGVVAS